MELNQPYYIDPRRDDGHLELDGEWSFFFSDTEITEFNEDMWKYKATMPRSVYHALCEALEKENYSISICEHPLIFGALRLAGMK